MRLTSPTLRSFALMTAEARDDKCSSRRRQVSGVRGDALCRVESGFEASGKLAIVFFDTEMRIDAVRGFHLYPNGRCAHQSRYSAIVAIRIFKLILDAALVQVRARRWHCSIGRP